MSAPFDIDIVTLFSDYPPPDAEFLSPPSVQDTFSDDILAIHQIQQDQSRKFDEEGVVIRHRPRDLGRFYKGNIRSSSNPPETPTPKPRPRALQKPNFGNNTEKLSPTSNSLPPTSPSTPAMRCTTHYPDDSVMISDSMPESSLLEYPSSPPIHVPTPPTKTKLVSGFPRALETKQEDPSFTYIEPDVGDGNSSMVNPENFLIERRFLASHCAPATQRLTPTTPQKARLNKIRKRGPFEDDDSDAEVGDIPTPLHQKPGVLPQISLDMSSDFIVPDEGPNDPFAPSQPRYDYSLPIAGTRTRPSKQACLPFQEEEVEGEHTSIEVKGDSNVLSQYLGSSITSRATIVPIRLDTGETLHIRRKFRKTRSYFRNPDKTVYDKDGNKEAKDSYYGIPIHQYLDEIATGKALIQYAKEKEEREQEIWLANRKGKYKATSNDAGITAPDDANVPCSSLLWTEKYRAKRFMDLLGDERTNRQVLRWLKSWEEIVFPGSKSRQKEKSKDSVEFYHHKKILLITGPPGLGKTTLAHVAARQAGYEPLEINASDDRSAAVVRGKIRDALSNEGVRIPGVAVHNGSRKPKAIGSGKPVCVIVDEIDGVASGSGDGSFITALVDLILQDQKNSKERNTTKSTARRRRKNANESFKFHRPVIAICNDLYAPSLRGLRPLAEIVYMRKPPVNLVVGRMKWVFEREGIAAEDTAIRRLVELATSGSSTSGISGGDIRCCLVGGEWIAKRLAILKQSDTNLKLTRKMVEEELEGREGGRGRGGVRGCVEKVFKKGDNTTKGSHSSRPIGVEARNRELNTLREEIECCGEFDKIITDCFSTCLTRPFHDDTLFTKPCAAYDDWLFFYDYLSSRVFSEQEFELSPYLSISALAFSHLFGTSSTTAKLHAFLGNNTVSDDPENSDPQDEGKSAIYTGLQAEYNHRENLKSIKSIISSFHTALYSPENPYTELQSTHSLVRFATAFKNYEMVVTELAPYLTRILSPAVKPVLISSSSAAPSIASVRKDSEKRLVNRAVEVMASVGIIFEKYRRDAVAANLGGRTTASQGEWLYRMEPAIDSLAHYPTYTPANKDDIIQCRFATRQVLMQEYMKHVIQLKEAARQARHAKYGSGPSFSRSSNMKQKPNRKDEKVVDLESIEAETASGKTQVRRDFFGRPVRPPSAHSSRHKRGPSMDESMKGNQKESKRVKLNENWERTETVVTASAKREAKVWVTYHEGYSNAVRKGITIEDLMREFC